MKPLYKYIQKKIYRFQLLVLNHLKSGILETEWNKPIQLYQLNGTIEKNTTYDYF